MRYNTGNPVGTDGSSDPRDLYDNSGVIDVWATDRTRVTAPDRLGVERRTLYGMEQQVAEWLAAQGFEPVPLIYVDGTQLTVDRPTQLIQRNDNLYSVKLPATFPVELSGTWIDDQNLLVAQVDRSLRDALASASGASMIGYRQRTVADRLNDTANVKDYGAIADGTYHPLSERFATLSAAQAVYPHATALTDSIDWAAFQAAINSGAPRVHTPGGHYVLNKGTLCTRDIVYSGDGYASHIDLSMAGVDGGILTRGDLVQISDLSQNINRGDRTLTFPSPPDLVPGDVIIVYNPTDGSWLSDRPSYRAGEMFRVHSISGNVATVYGTATSTYSLGAVDVYRLRGVRCTVDGLHVTPSATYSMGAIEVTLGDTVRLQNLYSSGVTLYTPFVVDRCFDVSINAVSGVNRSPSVNDEYGLTIASCQNFTITGSTCGATRHAVALGGYDRVCSVPNRNGLLYGLVLENIDLAADTYSGDMHGNADSITYDNCVFRNGVMLSGRNPTVRNSTIFGVSSQSGECVYGTECQGGIYTIENCRLITYGDGFQNAYIYISPSSSLVEGLLLTVRNVTVEAPNAISNTDVVGLRPRGATAQNCNALIDGLQLRAATARSFLRADDQVLATMNSGYLSVDNVFGPAGTALILANAKIANVPTKQMRQTGSVDVVTTAAQVVPATAQAFRYPYSKIPNAPSPGIYLPTGAAQGLIGASVAVPKVYEVNALAIRPAMIATTGTFTAGITVRLGWEASVDEV
ncbi:hypothetical protein [Pseudomonas taiwanensis]|uniref:phage tailspike polysaccharide lyase family protein n=1 Tax=Pseudomonas taiwanensis TaxID=470150 RepID=UPI00040830C4|nr:hypothetical protein [Pseudomonas taiwanensis]